jgi:hypothetical protein
VPESKHPAYHSLTRKFRKFMGILTNAEEVLKTDGFALADAYAYATGEHHRLDELSGVAGNDPTKVAELRREEEKVEGVLFERMSAVIDFIQTHQPDHELLPDYLVYRVRWRECLGEPVREAPPQTDDPSPEAVAMEAPSTYGVPWARLEQLRKRLKEIPLNHRLIAPYTVFASGLVYGCNCVNAEGRAAEHDLKDGLIEVSRQNLENAVDFALSAEVSGVAKESFALPPELSRLFMGIGYAQRSHPADVYEWLHLRGRSGFQNQLLRLLFAMGVRAATDVYARRLLSFASESSDFLAARCFGPDIEALVLSFSRQE